MNIKSIITAAMALLASTACSGGAKQEKVMKTEGKSIVVFFSHAGDNYAVGNIEVGNTKIVADYITELTGADQFEIVTHKYDGMAYNPLINLAKDDQVLTTSFFLLPSFIARTLFSRASWMYGPFFNERLIISIVYSDYFFLLSMMNLLEAAFGLRVL